MNINTQHGIAALKSGEKEKARQLLLEATRQDPDDAQAWLWLSGAVTTDAERVQCMQEVLRRDPENALAARGLAQLVARGAVSLQATSAPAPPTASPQLEEPAASRPDSDASAAEDEEAVIFEARPSLVPMLAFLVLLVGILVAIWLVLMKLLPAGPLTDMYRLLATVILGLYLLGGGLRWLQATLRRLFARYTLTDRRLIVQRGFLSRSRKTIPIRRLQDVSYQQTFVHRLLGVGTVMVESAGERGVVQLVDLPRCHEYAEAILELIEEQAS